VILADVDRTNQGLRRFFPDAVSPPNASDASVREWMAALIERQIKERSTVCIDFGGGDLIIKQIARQIGLVEFLTEYDIEPVAIHCIGADIDDLAYMQDVEQDGVFAPRYTAVVINEGVAPGHRDPTDAFRDVLAHPVMREVVRRGAVIVTLKRLDAMHIVDRHEVSFLDAAAMNGREGIEPPIGPWIATEVKRWLRGNAADFAAVDHMLP